MYQPGMAATWGVESLDPALDQPENQLNNAGLGKAASPSVTNRLHALSDEAFLHHRCGTLTWRNLVSPVLGIDFGEFRAEVDNLR
jgi:hypothetical protein